MAAKCAAIASLVAATAATAHAAEVETVESKASTTAEDLARKVRLGGAKGCGCAPCWGPPAPPAMDWLHDAPYMELVA